MTRKSGQYCHGITCHDFTMSFVYLMWQGFMAPWPFGVYAMDDALPDFIISYDRAMIEDNSDDAGNGIHITSAIIYFADLLPID